MYKRILIAFDDSPEARRALRKGIGLAKTFQSEIFAITVQEGAPPYLPIVAAVAPEAATALEAERHGYYATLLAKAQKTAEAEGLALHARLTEDDEVTGIASAVTSIGADLLVIGCPRRTGSLIGSLGSTAYKLTQAAACDVLEVH